MEISPEGSLTLTKDEARALAQVACADESRQSLCGVWFEAELLRAWATDGNRALMARRIGGHFMGRAPAVLVPREALLDTVRMCRGKADRVVVHAGAVRGADGDVRVLGAGAVIGLQAVAPDGTVRGSKHCARPDATPVPIDQVLRVPDRPREPGSAFGIDAALLGDTLTLLDKAAGRLDGGAAKAVHVFPPPDPLAPIGLRLRTEHDVEWLAAVMPCRTGVDLSVPRADAPEVGGAEVVPLPAPKQKAAAPRRRRKSG